MSDSWRPRQPQVARLARAQQSMIPGTVGGRLAQARPVQRRRADERGADPGMEAVFSYPGTPGVNEQSPPYLVTLADSEVGTVIAGTRSTTSGKTVVEILKNGNVVGSVEVPSGGQKTGETVLEDVGVDYGDHLTVRCSVVGSGLTGLTVHVLLEP